MSREPNNQATEEILKESKKWFFAIEHTAQTSPLDIDDFCSLLEEICPRYNMRWCQSIWQEDSMKKVKHK